VTRGLVEEREIGEGNCVGGGGEEGEMGEGSGVCGVGVVDGGGGGEAQTRVEPDTGVTKHGCIQTRV
jgi:hypothetical protein